MTPEKTFDKIVEMCGFSSVLGPGIVRRALKDEGTTPEAATADDYLKALPRLEQRMRAYMPPTDAESRARRVAGFLAHSEGKIESEDEKDWSMFGRSVEILKMAREKLSDSAEIPIVTAEKQKAK
jgi:hypothetical protein